MAELIRALNANKFPTLTVMCDYGLDGRQGTNPIQVFECYKRAIASGVTAEILEDAMKTDTLSRFCDGLRVQSGYLFPSDP